MKRFYFLVAGFLLGLLSWPTMEGKAGPRSIPPSAVTTSALSEALRSQNVYFKTKTDRLGCSYGTSWYCTASFGFGDTFPKCDPNDARAKSWVWVTETSGTSAEPGFADAISARTMRVSGPERDVILLSLCYDTSRPLTGR